MTDTAARLAQLILVIAEADDRTSCECREVTTRRGDKGVKVTLGWYGKTLEMVTDESRLWLLRTDPYGFHESMTSWDRRCDALRDAAAWLTGGRPDE